MKSLKVLYESNEFFAIEKPAMLHTVQGEGESVEDLLREQYPEQSALEEGGLVHRLDFSTSGILLVARSSEARNTLRDMFRKGRVQREYLALLEGELREERRVKNYIGSPYRRAKKVRCYEQEPGKPHRALPAVSAFRPEEYLEKLDATRVRVLPETGRRHQIRAHAASMGFPLLGDSLYGATASHKPFPDRDFFLHLARLSFQHPETGKKVIIESSPLACETVLLV